MAASPLETLEVKGSNQNAVVGGNGVSSRHEDSPSP